MKDLWNCVKYDMAMSMSFQNTKENSGTRYIFITQTMVFRVRFNSMESQEVCVTTKLI